MASVEELKSKFDSLTKTKEKLIADKVSAESRYQLAYENYEKTLNELREKFGVNSLEEAESLYAKKKSELEAILNKCELELGEE